MHKFSKRFLIPAAGLVIVAILAGLDLYVGSNEVRTRMETALQRELKVPVHLGGLHYTPWSGLRATNAAVEIAPRNEGRATASLSVPSVSASLGWYPLLTGRLVVRKLVFKAPELTWVQGDKEGWNLTHPNTQNIKPPKPSPPDQKKKPGSRRALKFGIDGVRIENATLRFIDHQGRPTVTFEGANIYLRDPENPEGTIAVGKTSLREGLRVENFSTPFSFRKKSIALAPISAQVAQGHIRGSATLYTTPELPTFTLDLLFDGIDLNGLLVQLGQEQTAERTEGKLQGNLDLYGTVGKKKSIEGLGHLRLLNGRMDQIALLQAIGKVLQIEELKELELHNAQLDLRAAEGKVFIDSMTMETINMELNANGTSEWDGKLNLAAHLAVAPKISRQLPGWMNASFQTVPGGNFRTIAFNITGTVTHPNTNLLGVLMGQKYKTQLLNLWQSLTGKGKKKGADTKKNATPASEKEDEAPPVP